MTSPAEALDAATEGAVVRVYEVCQVSLVRLPRHVIDGLKHSHQESVSITEESPSNVSNLMNRDERWRFSLTPEEKRQVLAYLCRPSEPLLLDGLELLPLADGPFCTFSDHTVFICRDSGDVDLLPGLQDNLCHVTQPRGLHELLQHLAQAGKSLSHSYSDVC